MFLGIRNITDDGRLDLSEIRHVSEEEFPRWTKRVLPQPGDIVFTYEATLNRYAIIPEGFRGCLGRRLALIRPDVDRVDTRYLFYYFFGEDWRRTISQNTLSGSTVDRIPLTQFPNFEVQLPPLSTQRKIASVLSAYDDLIENNTRRIEILEEMAQRIYQEWFVDFRFPGHEKVGMIESDLGPIPKGWQVKKVSEVASVHRGRSYKSAEIVEESGLPFLTLKCVDRDGGFRREGIKRYKGPYKETQTAKSGDIIMAVTDMTQERRIIARAARVPATGQDTSVFSMDLVKIEPDTKVFPDFLYGMLRFSTFPDEVKQHANGANVLHLNPSHIGGYDFVLPPAKLCNQYAEICSNIYRESDILHLKNSNLRRTRDLLLPKLISGEVEVDKVEVSDGF